MQASPFVHQYGTCNWGLNRHTMHVILSLRATIGPKMSTRKSLQRSLCIEHVVFREEYVKAYENLASNKV